jgi:hypothetical protein
MDVSVLAALIDELFQVGADGFGDADTVVELHRQQARLDAFVTEATASLEREGGWSLHPVSLAGWLAHNAPVSKRAAQRRVRIGRALCHLPAATPAWETGDIASDQVAKLASVRTTRTAEALARDEQFLVDQARQVNVAQFNRLVDYWVQRADPDGAEDNDERKRARRDVYLAESFQGMWLGKMTLDPIGGSIVAGELERREQELFEADWAEAKDRLGHDPVIGGLARTPAQRRADALVEMATRSATAPANGRRPAPLFTVHVGYETFAGQLCELARGTAVTPGSLLPWLDEAYIERVVFTGPNVLVDLGREQRLFPKKLRHAIALRDRHCQEEMCDVPADRCQADHVIAWADGGPTNIGNGRLLCGPGNREKERRRRRDGRPPDA